MDERNMLCDAYEKASIEERIKVCDALGITYLSVGDEIVLERTREMTEAIEEAREIEELEQLSEAEILGKLLRRGLEMEGYLKDTKGA